MAHGPNRPRAEGADIEPPSESSGDDESDVRRERLARNEVAFRRLNEGIDEVAGALGADATVYDFICECGRSDCFERVKLTPAAYEHVRADGARFLLVPGHQNLTLEQVVERHPGVIVVEKIGAAAAVAESEDPRAEG